MGIKSGITKLFFLVLLANFLVYFYFCSVRSFALEDIEEDLFIIESEFFIWIGLLQDYFYFEWLLAYIFYKLNKKN